MTDDSLSFTGSTPARTGSPASCPLHWLARLFAVRLMRPPTSPPPRAKPASTLLAPSCERPAAATSRTPMAGPTAATAPTPAGPSTSRRWESRRTSNGATLASSWSSVLPTGCEQPPLSSTTHVSAATNNLQACLLLHLHGSRQGHEFWVWAFVPGRWQRCECCQGTVQAKPQGGTGCLKMQHFFLDIL